jgi:hypothetical protein
MDMGIDVRSSKGAFQIVTGGLGNERVYASAPGDSEVSLDEVRGAVAYAFASAGGKGAASPLDVIQTMTGVRFQRNFV